MQSQETMKMLIRMPLDCKEWLKQQAQRNVTSQNGMLVLCVRKLMEAEEKAAR
jgi:hypothetical protein